MHFSEELTLISLRQGTSYPQVSRGGCRDGIQEREPLHEQGLTSHYIAQLQPDRPLP